MKIGYFAIGIGPSTNADCLRTIACHAERSLEAEERANEDRETAPTSDPLLHGQPGRSTKRRSKRQAQFGGFDLHRGRGGAGGRQTVRRQATEFGRPP